MQKPESRRLQLNRGQLPESQLIGKAETSKQKSDAYFYVGYEYFLRGDKHKAREYFQKTLETRIVGLDIYMVARARLKQIGNK